MINFIKVIKNKIEASRKFKAMNKLQKMIYEGQDKLSLSNLKELTKTVDTMLKGEK